MAAVTVGAYWYFEYKAVAPVVAEQTPRSYFEPLIPLSLGTIDMFASVADTAATRTLGLSRTTALPPDVVKLFVFENSGVYKFWMKEMLYPIDIIWLDSAGIIVHIEQAVSPESYPQTYGPDTPTRYVIETNADFFATTGLQVGDSIMLPVSTN